MLPASAVTTILTVFVPGERVISPDSLPLSRAAPFILMVAYMAATEVKVIVLSVWGRVRV
ncbi:hypothetical protein D9M69_704080 [compost metagenome]